MAKAPKILAEMLSHILPETKLIVQKLPDCEIHLWLVSQDFHQQTLNHDQMSQFWLNTPYWIFCWASGLALAKYLIDHPETVAGKTIIDFGAGSGVVAIAAKMAGAGRVVCCDCDLMSLNACRANAALNQVELEYSTNLSDIQNADLLLAADVLYDQENYSLLDLFVQHAKEVWIAESRVKNLCHSAYSYHSSYKAATFPDLDEQPDFMQIKLYKTLPERLS